MNDKEYLELKKELDEARYQISRTIAQLEYRHPPQLKIVVASVIAQLRAYEDSLK